MFPRFVSELFTMAPQEPVPPAVPGFQPVATWDELPEDYRSTSMADGIRSSFLRADPRAGVAGMLSTLGSGLLAGRAGAVDRYNTRGVEEEAR